MVQRRETIVTYKWLAFGADIVAIAALIISWCLLLICRKLSNLTLHMINTWEPKERATDEQASGM